MCVVKIGHIGLMAVSLCYTYATLVVICFLFYQEFCVFPDDLEITLEVRAVALRVRMLRIERL